MLRRWVNEWGSTGEERAVAWPCDAFLPDADSVLFRAVDVRAPAATTFRWVCQLRVAPYSYDWIDNGRRRSPRALTPGVEELEVGQRFMRIFDLVGFAPGAEITLRARTQLFGGLVVTYRVRATGAESSRIVVKMVIRGRRDLVGAAWKITLPAGDLVMMRKQLRTLARLAEGSRS